MQASETKAWQSLKSAVDRMLRSSQVTVAEFSHDALRVLESAGIAVEDVEGRPKSLRSIRSKLQRKSEGEGDVQVRSSATPRLQRSSKVLHA